ncbi:MULTISPECIES: hypothetical protein [Actinomadura]|uniref:Uncharacterized protein n=1 Tax=Actinomadura litoris TaxID=2678616 RepID=A0A7K1L981_9ACTN|nr:MULTISPECIES: hypothetical protein [Actinomadura]MBT2212981.1 hypothetical protein [Actinomadura sp. NEAU-AAG7]MUN40786.1 hypothetical protein [Actinomadura litoris]
MSEHRLWVRDINRLQALGRTALPDLANDVNKTKFGIDSLNLNPAAFGENPIRVEMERAYEDARAQFSKQLQAAYAGLRDSGNAIAKAADHYREIEKKLAS